MSTTNPRITNQWDDIHRRLGNYLPLEATVTEDEKTRQNVAEAEEADPLSSLSLKQLDTLEELQNDRSPLLDEELNSYRQKRLEELKFKQKAYKFGSVRHIGQTDFIMEVTEASKELIQTTPYSKPTETHVIVHVYIQTSTFSKLFNQHLETVAHKFGAVKFVKGLVQDIIPGLPEAKLPLVLIYKGGKCIEQIYGTKIWNNFDVSPEHIERILSTRYHVMDSDLVDEKKEGAHTHIYNDLHTHLKTVENEDEDEDEDEEEDDEVDDRGYSSMKLDRNKHAYRW